MYKQLVMKLFCKVINPSLLKRYPTVQHTGFR